jgi:hypothetical protein
MTERQDLDRAMTLAEMAPSRSVRFEILAGREAEYPGSRLHRPPVTYLEDTEAPAYVLTNGKRGIGVGTKRNTTTPSDERGSVILVTGRRILCLVGQEQSDDVIEIPHGEIAEVTYHTGFLGHRLAVKTPKKQYHCWVNRKTDESILGRATEYVRERIPEAPYEDEPESEDEATFSYRGQPVSRENHPGIPDEPPGDAEEEESDETDPAQSTSQKADPAANGDSDGDDQPQFTYRGQTVSRENHPGLPDEPPAESDETNDAEATESDGDSERGRDIDRTDDAVDRGGVRHSSHTGN